MLPPCLLLSSSFSAFAFFFSKCTLKLTFFVPQNGLEDLTERFDDGQANRLRILSSLISKDLPVDVSPRLLSPLLSFFPLFFFMCISQSS